MRIVRGFGLVVVWGVLVVVLQVLNNLVLILGVAPDVPLVEAYAPAAGSALEEDDPRAWWAVFAPMRPVGPIRVERTMLEMPNEPSIEQTRRFDTQGRLVEQRTQVGERTPSVTRVEYSEDGRTARVTNPAGLDVLTHTGAGGLEEARFTLSGAHLQMQEVAEEEEEPAWAGFAEVLEQGALHATFGAMTDAGDGEDEVVVYEVFVSVGREGRVLSRLVTRTGNVGGGLNRSWRGRSPGVRPLVREAMGTSSTVVYAEEATRTGRLSKRVDVLAGVSTRFIVQERDEHGNRVVTQVVREAPNGARVEGVMRHTYEYAPR